VPADYSATFVSLAQSMQYLSMIVAPLLGTWLADYIGLGGALWLSAGLRLFGFFLFLKPDTRAVLFRRVENAPNE
jgi:MFS family permease